MLAYTYVEQGKFALLDKPKPVLQNDRDAIVRVTLASICTSDLHIKHGSVQQRIGSAVRRLNGEPSEAGKAEAFSSLDFRYFHDAAAPPHRRFWAPFCICL